MADFKSTLHPNPSEFRIKRKPVSNPNLHRAYISQAPTAPPRPAPLRSVASSNTLGHAYRQHEDTNTLAPPTIHRSTSDIGLPRSHSDALPVPTLSSPSAVQKAYGEACHFLGNLINHPTESTRHFTILRHSHGVVFYRGSTTSVTVSVFADTELPPDRTYWLQSRGWSGNTGMKAKALFRLHNDWLNVTPSLAVTSDQVNPNDERAWQRGISKFAKKGPAKIRQLHRLRETAILRIPVEAGDGYFQVVLCQGLKKKVLCNSPVFRVLSTSMNPHSLRGASLSTLPLEVGAMVMSLYAQATVQRVVGPVASTVQKKIDPYQPSWVKKAAAEKAYSASDIGNNLVSRAPTYEPEQLPMSPLSGENDVYVASGPVAPFPITIKARGDPIQSNGFSEPKLNLKTSDPALDRLHGFFFAWSRLNASQKDQTSWYQSIISLRHLDPLQAPRVNMTQTMRRTITLRFVEDIQLPSNSKLDIRIMGYIRPDLPPPSPAMSQTQYLEARQAAVEGAILADACDVSLTQSFLDHTAWAPDQNQHGGWMDRTREEVNSMRIRGQRLVDDAPLHWIGVRSATTGIRDRQVAVNGFYIVR